MRTLVTLAFLNSQLHLRRIGTRMLVWTALVSVSACQPSVPNPTETLQSLQNMQQLATVSYEVTKVVKASDDQTWYKVGERKILITCQATIKAGIDLAKITADDVSVSGKKITIKLPPPGIMSVNLPPGNIKVAYQDVDFFRSSFTGAEIDGLMAQAEKQMWAAGRDLGIIEQAKVNSQLALSKLLMNMGFEEVTLTFDQPTLPAQR
jgi:Protein of unknown function (DUF4230)